MNTTILKVIGRIAAALLIISAIATLVFLVRSCVNRSAARQEAVQEAETARRMAEQAEKITADARQIVRNTGREIESYQKDLRNVRSEFKALHEGAIATTELHRQLRTEDERRTELINRRISELDGRISEYRGKLATLTHSSTAKTERTADADVAQLLSALSGYEKERGDLETQLLTEEMARNLNDLVANDAQKLANQIIILEQSTIEAAKRMQEFQMTNQARQREMDELHAGLRKAKQELEALLDKLK